MRRRVKNTNRKSSNSSSSSGSSKRSHYNNLISPIFSSAMPSSTTTSSSSTTYEQKLGITKRRQQQLEIQANLETVPSTSESMTSNPYSPKSPIIPAISDFMLHDEDYSRHSEYSNSREQQFLQQYNNITRTNDTGTGTGTGTGAGTDTVMGDSRASSFCHQQQIIQSDHAYKLQCAKFCTFFSLIAILFLVMVGVLIEVQPLYLRGISPARTSMSFRRMRESRESANANMDEKELLSFVHYSGRLRMLQSYYIHEKNRKIDNNGGGGSQSQITAVGNNGDSNSNINNKKKKNSDNGSFTSSTFDDDPVTKYEKYNEYLRSLSNQQKDYIIYEMKSEAKTAFKTAALYFVVMVLSIIYTQNFDRVHLLVGLGWTLWWRKVKHLIYTGGWKHCLVTLYNKYRRREYRDIPERNVGRGRGANSGGGGLDTVSAHGSIHSAHSLGNASNSRNDGDQLIGLSLRERELNSLKSSIASGGGHFEQQETRNQPSLSILSSLDDKPKKK